MHAAKASAQRMTAIRSLPWERPLWGMPPSFARNGTADGELTAGAQFGLRVRELRKQSGLTQEAVATDLYMSQSYLRKIEHGDANPSINMAARLLAYLEAASHPQGQEAVTS